MELIGVMMHVVLTQNMTAVESPQSEASYLFWRLIWQSVHQIINYLEDS